LQIADWKIGEFESEICNRKKMAKTSSIAKSQKKPKFSTRQHNRCKICGRPRGYLRKFGLCRLCFRGLALRGEVPGVSKSSW
jgi:small subunit ribosomal protein S14